MQSPLLGDPGNLTIRVSVEHVDHQIFFGRRVRIVVYVGLQALRYGESFFLVGQTLRIENDAWHYGLLTCQP